MKQKLRHLALIPDGNYRFSKKKNITYEEAINKGVRKINLFLQSCDEENIEEVTVWLFSTENMKRKKEKIQPLQQLLEKKYETYTKDAQTRIKKEIKDYQVTFVGDMTTLPKKIKKLILELQKLFPKKNRGMKVNFLVNYGSKQELCSVATLIANDVMKGKLKINNIAQKDFAKRLFLQSDIDMVIRTGGEQRMSGFLPFQTAYAELFFMKKLWPEMTKQDFKKLMTTYHKRTRRFGL